MKNNKASEAVLTELIKGGTPKLKNVTEHKRGQHFIPHGKTHTLINPIHETSNGSTTDVYQHAFFENFFIAKELGHHKLKNV